MYNIYLIVFGGWEVELLEKEFPIFFSEIGSFPGSIPVFQVGKAPFPGRLVRFTRQFLEVVLIACINRSEMKQNHHNKQNLFQISRTNFLYSEPRYHMKFSGISTNRIYGKVLNRPT